MGDTEQYQKQIDFLATQLKRKSARVDRLEIALSSYLAADPHKRNEKELRDALSGGPRY